MSTVSNTWSEIASWLAENFPAALENLRRPASDEEIGDVHRFVDLDPAPGGDIGQVIEVDPEGCCHKVIASSVHAYLAQYLDGLRTGRFRVSDDMIEATEHDSDKEWGVPDYLQQVEYQCIGPSDISAPIRLKSLVPDQVTLLTGKIVFLVGGAGENVLTLLVRDGVEYTIKATTKGTKGYGAISIGEFVIVGVKPNSELNRLTQWAGGKPPVLFATECKMVQADGLELKRRPWWKFW